MITGHFIILALLRPFRWKRKSRMEVTCRRRTCGRTCFLQRGSAALFHGFTLLMHFSVWHRRFVMLLWDSSVIKGASLHRPSLHQAVAKQLGTRPRRRAQLWPPPEILSEPATRLYLTTNREHPWAPHSRLIVIHNCSFRRVFGRFWSHTLAF